MAYSTAQRYQIQKCPSCHEVCEILKQLPCRHIFCFKCLEKHCLYMTEGDIQRCITCKRTFRIPRDGVKSLPNFKFQTRFGVQRNELHRAKKNVCELCLALGDNIEATSNCTLCKHLCAGCTIRHSKQNLGQSHRVVSLKDIASDVNVDKLKIAYCKKHDNEEIKLYCCDCKATVCQLCLTFEHRNHMFENLDKIAECLKKEIKSGIDATITYRKNCNDILNNLSANKTSIIEKVISIECAIRKKCKELRSLLETCQSELLLKLNTIKEQKLKELERKEELIELLHKETDTFMARSQKLLEHSTTCEIVQAADDFQNSAERFLNYSQLEEKTTSPEKDLEFIVSSKGTLENLSSMIGRISIQDSEISPFNRYSMPKFEVKRCKNSIQGIAVLHGKIFVVLAGQAYVNVYNSNSLRLLYAIKVPDMKCAAGLAACAYNQALYISDWKLQCIHRIHLLNDSVSRWKVKKDFAPFGVSVTTENRLLVTVQAVQRQEDTGNSGVVEYTSEGQQVSEIQFYRGLEWAWQTLQLEKNHFIACHGWFNSPHRVSIFCRNGQIISSYDGKEGSDNRGLDEPRSLAIDYNRKQIFVADFNNNRILLVGFDLVYLGEVQLPRDVNQPSRLYFDSLSDRLLVGETCGRLITISPIPY